MPITKWFDEKCDSMNLERYVPGAKVLIQREL